MIKEAKGKRQIGASRGEGKGSDGEDKHEG